MDVGMLASVVGGGGALGVEEWGVEEEGGGLAGRPGVRPR